MISPNSLGAPSQYTDWRPGQAEAFDWLSSSTQRYCALCLPTGSGKTLIYMMTAIVSQLRSVTLTSTKGLQSQILRDWNMTGMVDVRGSNNYQCLTSPKVNCDLGPCLDGEFCDLRSRGCHYYDAVRKAGQSQMSVTNYAYWITGHLEGDGILPESVGMLILDEAHDAPGNLASYLQIRLSSYDHRLPDYTRNEDWKKWAYRRSKSLLERKSDLDAGSPKRLRLTKQIRDLKRLSHMQSGWVHEPIHKGRSFQPVDVSTLADKHLFRGIDRVVLVSATIRRKTCHQLGIKDEDLDFREADSLWPVHRSPVIQVPAIRVNHKSTPLALKKWRTRIDQIIEGRCDRKGVIHTVSYARRDYLLDHSDYASIMITHDSSDTEKVIAKFRKLGPPAVLVSPSISTGYDLPGTDCEYIIIAKIPYPDGRGALAKARQDLDSDYTSYQAMQTLVQSCGRGLRYAQDRCEILVVDDNVIWFLSKYREFAPAWFRRKYRRAHQPPPPPPALDVDSESTTVL